jgi:hypothetical protein
MHQPRAQGERRGKGGHASRSQQIGAPGASPEDSTDMNHVGIAMEHDNSQLFGRDLSVALWLMHNGHHSFYDYLSEP